MSFSRLNEEDGQDKEEIENSSNIDVDDDVDLDNDHDVDHDEEEKMKYKSQANSKRIKTSKNVQENGTLSEIDTGFNFVTSISTAISAQKGNEGIASNFVASALKVDIPKEWWKGGV